MLIHDSKINFILLFFIKKINLIIYCQKNNIINFEVIMMINKSIQLNNIYHNFEVIHSVTLSNYIRRIWRLFYSNTTQQG